MPYLIIALIIYLAAALQTTVVAALQVGRITPQLPALVAVAILLVYRGRGGLILVALIGLIEDALWPGRLGVAMAWYLLLGWGLIETAERFDLRSLNRRLAATGVFAGLLACGIGATRLIIGETTLSLLHVVLDSACIGVYTSAIAAPFWLGVRWLENTHRDRVARYEF